MRYERQLLLKEISNSGQDKLNKAKVLVVGAGGLGCPVLTYLVCAGVGNIRIVDNDVICESNLNRQFLFGEFDIGKEKSKTAKNVLNSQNSKVKIEAITQRVTEENIDNLLENIDIVVDCVDNIETRLVMNKACIGKNIPLIEAGIEGFYGFVTIIRRETACLECMGFYESKTKKIAPVIGTTAGVIGSLQANECIKMILGLDSELNGNLLEYDGLNATLEKINVLKSQNCSVHNQLK